MQSEGERIRLFPLHGLAPPPAGVPPSPQAAAQQPQGDPVLGCSSNAVWWAADQLALVSAQGSLDILQMPSGDRLMSVEHQYFLPGDSSLALLQPGTRCTSCFTTANSLICLSRSLGTGSPNSQMLRHTDSRVCCKSQLACPLAAMCHA